jgi:hypothetical protein
MSIKGYSVATIDNFVGHELGVSDWVVVDQARKLHRQSGPCARCRTGIAHLFCSLRRSRPLRNCATMNVLMMSDR